jgi:hypothetical protein
MTPPQPWPSRKASNPPELSAATHELRAQPIGPVDPASLIVAARVPLSTHFEHDWQWWQWWQCGSVAVRKLLFFAADQIRAFKPLPFGELADNNAYFFDRR